MTSAWGRSPRVRGSLRLRPSVRRDRGSIPACAGEPRPERRCRSGTGVDPRVCGGAVHTQKCNRRISGRSPRVRGSHDYVHEPGLDLGSIPACAGEPYRSGGPGVPNRVDPRVCGGADAGSGNPVRGLGRSPRVRGSRGRVPIGPVRFGSIPACAGEPDRAAGPGRGAWVDPRVCGGARILFRGSFSGWGRSPRVRGSLSRRGVGRGPGGSIPACAGEPMRTETARKDTRVDPRVCGGAGCPPRSVSAAKGRSPRVRGSLRELARSPVRVGSIPACAGEPISDRLGLGMFWVDPRVCGGAQSLDFRVRAGEGRSPRVRGSPERVVGNTERVGSIPACAGEPWRSGARRPVSRVDPRVCGGAGS